MSGTSHRPGDALDFVQPTDFEILREMADAQRYTSLLVADEIDITSDYASARLGDLATQSALHIVHDADRCRLYRISPIGAVALAHEGVYEKQHAEEFGRQSWRVASLFQDQYQVDITGGDGDREDDNRHGQGNESYSQQWHPNLILWTELMYVFLSKIREQEPVPSHALAVTGYSPSELDRRLYQLYFFGLVDRDEGNYVLTDTGVAALEVREELSDPDRSPENWPSDQLRFNGALQERGEGTAPDWYDTAKLGWRLSESATNG